MSVVARSFDRARKRAGAVAIRSLFQGAARAFVDVPIARPGWHDLVVDRDVPYLGTGLAAHTYDVWRPKDAKGPLPLCCYVHGGAFRALSKDTHWIMALAFARRGMCVVLPNYRLAPQHRYPAAHEDTALALRHVLDHKERWGVDDKNVVLAGESAGANIVMGLAVGQAWARPEPHLRPIADVDIKAVVAACGVFQVGDPTRFHTRYPDFHWFYRDRCQELTEFLPLRDGVPFDDELASPLLLIEKEAPQKKVPPMFLPVGGGDFLIDDHERMERALQRHGVDVAAPVYGKEVHAFHAFIWRREARRCWTDTADFLRAHGVPLREPPPVL
jgi:acetyl esterase